MIWDQYIISACEEWYGILTLTLRIAKKQSRAFCPALSNYMGCNQALAGEGTRNRKSLPPSDSGKAPYMEKLYMKRSAIRVP